MDSKPHISVQHIVKYSRKNILVLYFIIIILCKFTWIFCVFIALQEGDILAHERMTDKQVVTHSECDRLKYHLLVNQ